jgi:plastocyanin
MRISTLGTRILGLASAAVLFSCVGGTLIGEPGPGQGDDDDSPPAAGDDDTTPNPDPNPPDAGPPPTYKVSLSPAAAELVLGETKTFTVTVTPENGFSGAVALEAVGARASWLTSFDNATVNVAGGPATATLTVKIPTDAEAGTALLAVKGTSDTLSPVTPNADVVVKPELVIRIPQGSVDNPENSFGPAGKNTVRLVAPGTKITWINDDTVPHRIHGDNANGLNHEPNNMAAAGGSYTVTITKAGVYNYRCHIHSQMEGTLIIQ